MSTETLRPDSGGDETNLKYNEGSGDQAPDVNKNYEMVDEVVSDDATTRVASITTDNNWRRDLYNLPASSGSGTINKITVKANARWGNTGDQASLKIAVKSGVTAAEGSEITPDTTWTVYSQEWALNPDDSAAWEWADIDDLQIGVNCRRAAVANAVRDTRATQVWVEVDYTAVAAFIPKVMIF